MIEAKGSQWGRRVAARSAADLHCRARAQLSLTATQLAVLSGGVAALLEESGLDASATELREFVRLHGKLYRLMGWPPEYVYRDGAVCYAADSSRVLKRAARISSGR